MSIEQPGPSAAETQKLEDVGGIEITGIDPLDS